ncbi:methylated-DNA--[protein]-cysteine S-methyltransferase [Rariglobus hedericola]|uniref:Methylated-DNA--protein-cysteine methyltransferase n=1 Tax=Rariglobus hedericola TaxID=2597822 RepID=A0A556QMZ2_9BACT|nr:methylated-DNA--[protein]-cysteine S-methyltransferase [Rariglobus hedericola]TSJ78016.1 methylated-DNA--[protein]-cysteine S-methyltransferase [Rariglobus hedericola]
MKPTAPTFHTTTFPTPCGPFSVAVDDTGAVVATAFGDLHRLSERLKPTCNLISDKLSLTIPVKKEVDAYFSGKLHTFTVPLAAQGTEFQHKVWSALVAIPYGETRSYGGLAADLGNPTASRAVGSANGANPICLLVPCHRVIGADGSLTGFAFGEDIKRQLLALEGALPPQLIN